MATPTRSKLRWTKHKQVFLNSAETCVGPTKSGYWFRLRTVLLGQGTLKVRATDFARVYRRIVVECIGTSPSCAILESGSGPRLEIPLRSGASTFAFMQTGPDLSLNMRVSLV